MSEEYILQVKDLHTSFYTDSGEVKAVNGVTFNLAPGKILGIVGESGSGKSVTAYSIMQILANTGRCCIRDRISRSLTRSRCGDFAANAAVLFFRIP